MNFEVKKLDIKDVLLIKTSFFFDDRGFFQEIFRKNTFKELDIPYEFNQYNYSYSKQNVIRGLHYQLPPHDQGKLIIVISGHIQDVAVDLRQNSCSFQKSLSVELNNTQELLYIPPGFAHGFAVLSKEAHVIYACTNEYHKESDKGVKYNDPELDISWQVENPILSEKDQNLPMLKEAKIFL